VSNRGWLLPDTASLGNGRDDWACTLDVDTGLTWEVKPENGPRSATYKYTWRRGSLGIVGNMSSCGNSLDGAACNTQNYVDAVNDAVLCGAADWRVSGGSYSSGYVSNNPHGELAVLYQRLFAASGIDPADWMPNLQPFWYWTDVTYPVQVSSSWAVNFGTAKAFYNYWDSPYHVVLVSDTAGDTFFADGFDEAADFVEGFDSLDEVNAHGWLVGNMSEPEGEFGWFYGGDNVFPAQAGASTSQVHANYAATVDAGGTISAWLLTPLLEFRAGSTLSFWTRTVTGASRADRLQVLVCQGTPCDYVGPGALGYSDFGTLLLDINPSQLTGDDETGVFGYPDHWTRFTLDATQGIPTGGYGRIAFRYFVEDGGLNGASSNYIGLDSVRVEAILAE
ncbi:MAG TPA: choice-of-anchor J domain-containing protein, partial [Rhodanobacteraceae bacterium]|nr:choice-of-anchor J domain-containing protein [Rhodanobacteraceae bacterium]